MFQLMASHTQANNMKNSKSENMSQGFGLLIFVKLRMVIVVDIQLFFWYFIVFYKMLNITFYKYQLPRNTHSLHLYCIVYQNIM